MHLIHFATNVEFNNIFKFHMPLLGHSSKNLQQSWSWIITFLMISRNWADENASWLYLIGFYTWTAQTFMVGSGRNFLISAEGFLQSYVLVFWICYFVNLNY